MFFSLGKKTTHISQCTFSVCVCMCVGRTRVVALSGQPHRPPDCHNGPTQLDYARRKNGRCFLRPDLIFLPVEMRDD